MKIFKALIVPISHGLAILQKNIDPNIQDENGYTALEVTGNFEKAKMLLEYGATVNDIGIHATRPCEEP